MVMHMKALNYNSENDWPGDFQRNPPIYRHDYLFCKGHSDKIRKSIRENIREKVKILDVGCNYKPYFPFFEGLFESYIGLDIHEGEHIDVVAKAEKIPFPDNSFDVILCFQVLEHIENPEKAISEMRRVLKDGGLLMLTTHGTYHEHMQPYDYWRWTRYGLRKILKNFSDVQVEDLCPPGMSIFEIVNLYFQRLNIFHVMTPLLVFNNIMGRVIDKVLPESVLKDLFVISYFVSARK